MKVTIAAGGPGDPDVQALVAALRDAEPGVQILYRLKTGDGDAVHNVLHFIAEHRAEAAIYVGGVVTKKFVDIVADWAKSHWFGRNPAGDSVTIYGPNEEVVKVIRRDPPTS